MRKNGRLLILSKQQNAMGVSNIKLPDKWKECRIEDIATIYVGKDLKEDSYSKTQTEVHIYPVYSNSVDNYGLYGYYDFEEYPSNCLTVVGRGVGLGTAFPRTMGFGAIGRLLVIVPKESSFDVRYLSEFINTRLIIFNESSGIPQLPGTSFAKYKVILPTYKEQVVIADILEQWDTAIEKTEALIAAKEKRFKWLLKTLISDQQDNPEWQRVQLGEMYNISAAGDFNAKKSSPIQDEEHPYPIYSNALTNKGLHSYSTYAKYSEDSITITGRGDIGFANHRKEKFMAIGRLLILKNKSSVSNEFVCEYINHSIRFHKETTGVPQLTAPQVSKYCIVLPSLAEQKKIGYMLNVAKNEIFLLQRLVEQYRTQKRGLMQKLLTGKWKITP